MKVKKKYKITISNFKYQTLCVLVIFIKKKITKWKILTGSIDHIVNRNKNKKFFVWK